MSNATMILVGNAKGGTLATFRVDDETLTPVGEVAVGAGCSTFAIDADRNLVHVATKEPSPAIVTWQLDRDGGQHREVARREVDDPLAYLALSPNADLLLAASYHGGWGASHRVVDGVVGAETGRVNRRNVHASVFDPSGRNAYFVSLGEDLIVPCAITDEGGLDELPDVPVTAGSGPRHLIFAPDGRTGYLMTEFTGEAVRFNRDDAGRLTRAEQVPAFDPTRGLRESAFGLDPVDGHLIWGADLALAGDGRWLVCSERTESTIGAIAVAEDGRLAGAPVITATEEQPRGLTVSPDGRHAVVLGELSGHATLYRIEDDGSLTVLSRVETGAGPNWVRYF